jgi:GR25 family glycosyltransferase involved in LPS biosynthesis
MLQDPAPAAPPHAAAQNVRVAFINAHTEVKRRTHMADLLASLHLQGYHIMRQEAHFGDSPLVQRLATLFPETMGYALAGPQRGCIASHANIMLECLQDPHMQEHDWCLFLEDDAERNSTLTAEDLGALLATVLRDPSPEEGPFAALDMVQWGIGNMKFNHDQLLCHPKSAMLALQAMTQQAQSQLTGPESHRLSVVAAWGFSTHAYAMRKSTMRRFLRSPFFGLLPIDWALMWFASLLNADPQCQVPAAVAIIKPEPNYPRIHGAIIQRDLFPTTVGTKGTNRHERRMRRFYWPIKRFSARPRTLTPQELQTGLDWARRYDVDTRKVPEGRDVMFQWGDAERSEVSHSEA